MKSLSDCIILAVDDTEANIDILVESLGGTYEIVVALDGSTALEIVEEEIPDLILLDIMMPELDGYEVCKRLKANPKTAEVPVIFLTAMTEIDSKTKGFELGAIDYITKPFEVREVEARVKTHLLLKLANEELKIKHQELRESYDSLQAAENARDSLMHMIVHDMRTPLTGIRGSLDVFEMLFLEKINEDAQKLIKNAQSSSTKLIEMVSSLLDLGKLEAGKMPIVKEMVSLEDIIKEAIDIIGEMARNVIIEVQPFEDKIVADMDRDIIRRVITNLLANAIKFTPSGKNISIEANQADSSFRLSIKDSGPGIPENLHELIFEKFAQAKLKEENKNYSSGIGLAFCKLAIEAHGGEIAVLSEVGNGSEFYFELPLK